MNGYYYFAVRSEQSGLAGGVVGMVMVEWRQGLVQEGYFGATAKCP